MNRSVRNARFKGGILAATVVLGLALWGGTTAVAADRIVIAENFTRTTCGYCQYAGRALHRMLETYPDSFVSVQCHIDDGYGFGYTSDRYDSYGGGGTPLTWFDGVLRNLGVVATNDNLQYEHYVGQYNQRIGVPTDITISIAAVEVEPAKYDLTVTVSMDANGTARDLVCRLLQVLDYYPAATDNRYRNCVRRHRMEEFHLNPGESYSFVKTIALQDPDIAAVEDVKFIAFTHVPGDTGAREIHNVSVLGWPFTAQPVTGDVDGDGDVDLSDLAALLGVYGLCEGDPGYNDAADFVDDGCINISDLAALLSNYGYPG